MSSSIAAVDANASSNDDLTLRLILTRDEINYLFGFDGVLLDQLRQQTGAEVTLYGAVDAVERVCAIRAQIGVVFKAFSLICRKLWDFISGLGDQRRSLVIRLAVQAALCGSVIGKHGAKVNEIKRLTGANVQVGQESLPNSTERIVEISGSGEACLQCAYQVSLVLQESKIGPGAHMRPYEPQAPQQPMMNADWKPVFLCGEKAYVIDGAVAIAAPPDLLKSQLGRDRAH